MRELLKRYLYVELSSIFVKQEQMSNIDYITKVPRIHRFQ